MSEDRYYDPLETRSPAAREADYFAALPRQVAHAKANAPHFARLFADVDPAAVTSRDALARLPLTRKAELIDLQREAPPFGGLNAVPPASLPRLFQSPGPIHDPEGAGPDWWRSARAVWAAGFRPGDILHNAFAYHLTPGGSMMEMGAHAVGCAVIPGGTGQSEMHVRALAALGATGYTGTPSFLKILLDKAAEMQVPLPALKRVLVAGEAFLPPLRAELAEKGIAAFQCYASADLGLIAYESEAHEGLIADEGILLELVRPGTGDPVEPGEVGEVVATLLYNREYPLIRFATGDLSALLPGTSPCGRTNMRIKGWMGRADQTTKVRGMFVHPAQVAEAVKRHAAAGRYRLVVGREEGGGDSMVLKVEAASPDPGLGQRLTEALQSVTKLRGVVELVPPGSLPNDGKVIEDTRTFS